MSKLNKSSTGTLNIDMGELASLKGLILKDNLQRVSVTSEYELLRIKDDDISIIVYKSGKVVHNGKEASIKVLKKILHTDTEFDYILGSDETGKGEWYGPLVATCMALKPSQMITYRILGVRDSKDIRKEKLLEIANEIIGMRPVYKSRILMPETYNRMQAQFVKEGQNLNDLLAWAHSAAIKDVLDTLSFNRVKLVIDKFDVEKMYARLTGINKSKITIIQKSKGESEIPVAAASIIAKRAFETSVDELDTKYALNLRKQKPENIDPKKLPKVAKTHFKNIKSLLL